MTPAPRRLLHSHANVEFLPSSYRIFVALTDGVVHPGPADKRDVPGLNFGRNSEGRVCCSSMKELVVKILNSSPTEYADCRLETVPTHRTLHVSFNMF